MKNAIAYKDLEDMESLIRMVSETTGLSAQNISAQFLESNIRMFNFEDTILISPDEMNSLIDSWADDLKTKLKR